MKKIIAAFMLMTGVSSVAFAADNVMSSADSALNSPDVANEDIYIYDFGYGGNGCPNDSASAVMTPDHKKISIFFDEYIADSTMSNRGRDRKSCNLGVAVNVPQGLTVALIGIDYRGFVDNGPGATAELSARYFFAGQSVGNRLRKVWKNSNGVTQDFTVDDEFFIGSIVWSPCGDDAIIRANTSLKAYESRNGDPAYIQVDTIDATADVVYQLQWKTCTPEA